MFLAALTLVVSYIEHLDLTLDRVYLEDASDSPSTASRDLLRRDDTRDDGNDKKNAQDKQCIGMFSFVLLFFFLIFYFLGTLLHNDTRLLV